MLNPPTRRITVAVPMKKTDPSCVLLALAVPSSTSGAASSRDESPPPWGMACHCGATLRQIGSCMVPPCSDVDVYIPFDRSVRVEVPPRAIISHVIQRAPAHLYGRRRAGDLQLRR